jgi:hypothetical protein
MPTGSMSMTNAPMVRMPTLQAAAATAACKAFSPLKKAAASLWHASLQLERVVIASSLQRL